ncbi:cytochrome P450 [Roridomyces roridus]|uniref:Cytochrome P450 n=1 Tax=Roridomyces roridus TaxID=1738132 RepID=A0AAD7BCR4_9AGAR|nr:cytochrome P450 [Roridomyces roridus]
MSLLLCLPTAILLCTTVYAIHEKLRLRLALPPGPRGRFISGVTAILPRSEPWKKYAEWAARYGGSMTSFRVYNRHILILNTHTAVSDLLDRRAQLYSERPVLQMYHLICGRGLSVFNIPASYPRHKLYRRLLKSGLNLSPADVSETLEEEVGVLMRGLVERPGEWRRHLRRNAAAVIMKIAFGYSISQESDPFISAAEQSSKISVWAMEPGRWLVDYCPILRYIPSWLPCAGFKRQGAEWRSLLDELGEVPHQWVKEQMAAGTALPSFTSRHLSHHEDEDVVKWSAAALYVGATDTTIAATTSFIMLMALHPAIQKRAREEIMLVSSAAPSVADVKNSSYLGAVLKEVLRYAPVANLALPHSVSQEDTYAGYRIPAGTTVLPNVWAIMHDAEMYPKPFTFNPERFLGNHGCDQGQQDPNRWAWGFGRRVCPGRHLAETMLLLNMASLLYHFDISPESPEQFLKEVEFTSGHTSHIKPFAVRFEPRIANE